MNHASDNGADAYTREETYAATRRPVDLAQTLLPDAYTSAAFFAIERDRVFAAGWVVAGCVAQVREPGDFLVAEVGGRSVIVVRHRDGGLRAFYNVCRHRGARLLTTGERRVERFIRCPYHSWAYDLDGACLGTPLFTGSDIPADQQAAFDMDGVQAFDSARPRPAAGRRRRLGPARVRQPRRRPRAAPRAARRPARADGRLPPRRVGDRAHGGVRDRRELQARRRELHGVLPPALGASGAREGLADRGPPPLAGARHVRRVLHVADRREHRRGRLGERPRADLGAERGRRHAARGSSGCSRTSRSTCCPTTSSSCSRGRRARG